MHGYDVHEELYQNCEMHGPCVMSTGPKARSIWSWYYSQNKCMAMKSTKSSLDTIKFIGTVSGDQVLGLSNMAILYYFLDINDRNFRLMPLKIPKLSNKWESCWNVWLNNCKMNIFAFITFANIPQ